MLLHRSWSGGSIFCRVGQDAPICVCGGCRKLDNTWLGMEPARVKLSLQQLENRFEIQTFEFKFSTLRCVSVVFFLGGFGPARPQNQSCCLALGTKLAFKLIEREVGYNFEYRQILNKDQICKSAAANGSCYNYETCTGSAELFWKFGPLGFNQS